MAPRHARWSALWLSLAAVALALGAARELALQVPVAPRAPFDSTLRERIRDERPDVVFLGNSMLGSRLFERRLNRRVAPRRAIVHPKPAAMSSRWYLQLKNSVLAAGVRPLRVAIFFRDTKLTEPLNHVTVRYHAEFEAESLPDEPTLDRVLARAREGVRGRLLYDASRLVPLHHLARVVEPALDGGALGVASAVLGATVGPDRKRRINALFDYGGLRRDTRLSPPPAPRPVAYEFDRALQRSFLPELLALGDTPGVSLYFVEVRKSPTDAQVRERPEHLARYAAALAEHLREHGAHYIDLYRRLDLSADWFAEGDHIRRDRRIEYTDRFVEAVPELFSLDGRAAR